MQIDLLRPLTGEPPYLITQTFAHEMWSEPFGYRYHDGTIGYHWQPGVGAGHFHNGVDYAVFGDSAVRACAAGTVGLAGLSPSGFGLRLMIDHGLYWSLYGHLSMISVVPGQQVGQGQQVALSGGGNGDVRDGNSTGPHLHWSIIRERDSHYVQPWVGERTWIG